MLYRALVLGMLGAIALLIATLPGELEVRRVRAELAVPPPGIVHLSRAAVARSPLPFDASLATAIGLAPDERIGRVQLTVTDGVTERRVDVVVEP